LLEAAYSAFGREDCFAPGEEALRKAVDRFKRDNPETVTDPEEREQNRWRAIFLIVILWLISRAENFAGLFKKAPGGDSPPKTDVPAPSASEPPTSTPSTSPPSAAASSSPYALSDEDKRKFDEMLKAAAPKFPADKEPGSGSES
jgi:hypothetical protein